MENRRIVILIEYLGAAYIGWQKQKSKVFISIQGLLEKVYQELFKEEIKIIGASRTDRGVHAKYQIAHFDTNIGHSEKIIQKALNWKLPKDIRIRKITVKKKDFHARFSVKKKRYIYRIYNEKICPVFIKDYVYWLPRPKLNFDEMKAIFQLFIGKKDFKNFCSKSEERNTIREINSIEIIKCGNRFDIIFEGQSFLRKMLRMIIGYGLNILIKRKKKESITEAFLEKENSVFRLSAPAKGLCLEKIWY